MSLLLQILFWDAFSFFLSFFIFLLNSHSYKGLRLNVPLSMVPSLLVLCASTHLFVTELSHCFLSSICISHPYQAGTGPGGLEGLSKYYKEGWLISRLFNVSDFPDQRSSSSQEFWSLFLLKLVEDAEGSFCLLVLSIKIYHRRNRSCGILKMHHKSIPCSTNNMSF